MKTYSCSLNHVSNSASFEFDLGSTTKACLVYFWCYAQVFDTVDLIYRETPVIAELRNSNSTVSVTDSFERVSVTAGGFNNNGVRLWCSGYQAWTGNVNLLIARYRITWTAAFTSVNPLTYNFYTSVGIL
jgi:hypothetical protein